MRPLRRAAPAILPRRSGPTGPLDLLPWPAVRRPGDARRDRPVDDAAGPHERADRGLHGRRGGPARGQDRPRRTGPGVARPVRPRRGPDPGEPGRPGAGDRAHRLDLRVGARGQADRRHHDDRRRRHRRSGLDPRSGGRRLRPPDPRERARLVRPPRLQGTGHERQPPRVLGRLRGAGADGRVPRLAADAR